MGRQLVRHGHFLVNGRKVDVPSFRVTESDIVEVRPSSVDLTPFVVARAEAGEREIPAWLEVISSKMRILVHRLPVRQHNESQLQEQLIVELYSKEFQEFCSTARPQHAASAGCCSRSRRHIAGALIWR
jgi:small subunit ribosomal protein S4